MAVIWYKSTRLDVQLILQYPGIVQWGFSLPETQFLAAYLLCQLVFHLDIKKKKALALASKPAEPRKESSQFSHKYLCKVLWE